MTVRTITLTKEKLTPTALALLDWGDWTGKPTDLEDQIVVPIACDDDYDHKTFRLLVFPGQRIQDQRPWTIRPGDLSTLDNNDVNIWWNTMAELWLDQIEKEGLSLVVPEEIAQIPTRTYLDTHGSLKRET